MSRIECTSNIFLLKDYYYYCNYYYCISYFHAEFNTTVCKNYKGETVNAAKTLKLLRWKSKMEYNFLNIKNIIKKEKNLNIVFIFKCIKNTLSS